MFFFLLARTWRLSVEGDTKNSRFSSLQNPRIFVFFHGQMLPLFRAKPDGEIAALVSSSRDGDIAASVLNGFGLSAVRGSVHRSPRRGLVMLLRQLRKGIPIAVAVDGSRGPLYKVHHGVFFLAARSKAPIVPVVAAAHPVWVFNSWDRFRLPLPFSRVKVSFGKEIKIEADSLRGKIFQLEKDLREEMLKLTEHAERDVGGLHEEIASYRCKL